MTTKDLLKACCTVVVWISLSSIYPINWPLAMVCYVVRVVMKMLTSIYNNMMNTVLYFQKKITTARHSWTMARGIFSKRYRNILLQIYPNNNDTY